MLGNAIARIRLLAMEVYTCSQFKEECCTLSLFPVRMMLWQQGTMNQGNMRFYILQRNRSKNMQWRIWWPIRLSEWMKNRRSHPLRLKVATKKVLIFLYKMFMGFFFLTVDDCKWRVGLVQAVESYRMWLEGPGFESRSSRIVQARVRLATDTLS